MNIVPLCAPLLGFGVLVHQTGEEGSIAVRVPRDRVETQSGRDPDNGPEETALRVN